MHRIIVLGTLVVILEAASAICAWPESFGIRSRPDYWLVAVGLAMALLFLMGWLAMALNDRQFEAAVEVTATINALLMENLLTDERKNEIIEPDPRFEQNSGLMRWKKGQGGFLK